MADNVRGGGASPEDGPRTLTRGEQGSFTQVARMTHVCLFRPLDLVVDVARGWRTFPWGLCRPTLSQTQCFKKTHLLPLGFFEIPSTKFTFSRKFEP